MNAPANSSNDARTPRDMAGYIARNDRRSNDRQPNWRGKVMIGGKEYLLSLWEKDANLMSLAVTDPDTMPPRPNQGQGQGQGAQPAPAVGGQGQSSYPSAQAQPPVGGDPFGDIFSN